MQKRKKKQKWTQMLMKGGKRMEWMKRGKNAKKWKNQGVMKREEAKKRKNWHHGLLCHQEYAHAQHGAHSSLA